MLFNLLCMVEYSTDYFTIIMHHGGYFLSNQYMEWDLAYFDFCEVDKMSLFELHSMAEMVGRVGLRVHYWKMLDIDSFVEIATDADVMEMCRHTPPSRYINVYQEYRVNVDCSA